MTFNHPRIKLNSMKTQMPYVVGNGMYCEPVAQFTDFQAALEYYKTISQPSKGEWRAVSIWNERLLDVDSNGLTFDEVEIMNDYHWELENA